MPAVDVLDQALHWETQRQNRALQEALEQKKRQRIDEARRSAQRVAVQLDPAIVGDADAPGVVPVSTGEWVDHLHRIPDMRSALVPFDDAADGAEWSRPFSLFKANVEPWLSFMRGYNTSRLFLDTSLVVAGEPVEARSESQVDFPVRALLDLKKVPLKVIIEPPVQINRQVEYQDLEAELRVNRDSIASTTLLKLAREVHEKQLAKAVEQGRQLGDRLHDALMGEGHVNLIRAWERCHRRKPSVEELHLMLTTGRVRADQRRPATVRAAPPSIPPQELESPPAPPSLARAQGVGKMTLREGAPAKAIEHALHREDPSAVNGQREHDKAVVPPLFTPPGGVTRDERARRLRKVLWYALHAAVCSGAIVAYLWMA